MKLKINETAKSLFIPYLLRLLCYHLDGLVTILTKQNCKIATIWHLPPFLYIKLTSTKKDQPKKVSKHYYTFFRRALCYYNCVQEEAFQFEMATVLKLRI